MPAMLLIAPEMVLPLLPELVMVSASVTVNGIEMVIVPVVTALLASAIVGNTSLLFFTKLRLLAALPATVRFLLLEELSIPTSRFNCIVPRSLVAVEFNEMEKESTLSRLLEGAAPPLHAAVSLQLRIEAFTQL